MRVSSGGGLWSRVIGQQSEARSMRFLPHWNTTARLVVLFLATLIPIAASGFILVNEDRTLVNHQVLDVSLTTADVVASRVDASINDDEMLLRSLALQPEIGEHDRFRSELAFARVFLANSAFRNIFAADQSNQVFASLTWTDGHPSDVPTSYLSYLRPFQAGPVVSDRLGSDSPQLPLILITEAINDPNGERAGSLAGVVSLGELQLDLTTVEEQQHVSILIVDSRGNVLVDPDWSKVYGASTLLGLAPVRAALHRDRGTMEYTGVDGGHWLAAYTPTHQTNWAVVVTRPSTVVYSQVNNAFLRNLAYLGISILLASIAALLLIRQITRPLRDLVKRSSSLLDKRDDLATGRRSPLFDDMQQLIEAFNVLASSLSHSDSDRHRLENEARQQTEQLDRLIQRMERIRETERRQLAFDIHDGLAQSIAGLTVEFRQALRQTNSDPTGLQTRLDTVQSIVEQMTDEVDVLLGGLRRPDFAHGLEAALDRYLNACRRCWGLNVTLIATNRGVSLPHQRLAMYRIVQEAVNNARKHAEATHVRVHVGVEPGVLQVTIEDDGHGFDVKSALRRSGHLGLLGMRERVRRLKGQFAIDSAVGRGTRIVVTVPLVEAKERDAGAIPHVCERLSPLAESIPLAAG